MLAAAVRLVPEAPARPGTGEHAWKGGGQEEEDVWLDGDSLPRRAELGSDLAWTTGTIFSLALTLPLQAMVAADDRGTRAASAAGLPRQFDQGHGGPGWVSVTTCPRTRRGQRRPATAFTPEEAFVCCLAEHPPEGFTLPSPDYVDACGVCCS